MSSSKQHSFKGEKEGPAPPPYEENSGNGQNAGKSVCQILYDGEGAALGGPQRLANEM